MSKLIMMRGLPASGKSTRAKEIIEETGNTIRVNRDLLRKMLHFDKWTGSNESITIAMSEMIALQCLTCGINVIIDDTNLGERHKRIWSDIAKRMDAKFQIEEMNVDIKELFERDANRENSVGKHVILSLAIQHGLLGPENFGTKNKWIICDLDGTLADISHRLCFVKTNPKDWKSFFDAIPQDKVIVENKKILSDFIDEGYPIIFVSGRPDSHRKETKDWIENEVFGNKIFREGVEYATILMRRKTDHRPDNQIKEEILKTYFKPENIECVIDDRPRVIEMWRSHDIKVIDVGHGIDF